MKRKILGVVVATAAVLALAALPAAADSNRGGEGNRADTPAPAFIPDHVWVDGVQYDTQILGEPGSLPSNDHNADSFNDLYVVMNFAGQDGPIAEYTPGDVEYRGGRWLVEATTWTNLAAAEQIESLDELHAHEAAGHLTISAVPDSGFLCPILPN